MPIAITTRENFDFVLEDERESEDKTTFQCRPLTTVEFQQCLSAVGGEVAFLPFKAAKMGLLGWKNFKDSKGNEIRFETKGGVVSDRCVNMLPPQDLVAIGREIINRSTAEPEDLGK